MMKRIFYILCVALLMPITASATHIIGGNINYKYVGNDTFEISLVVYADCYFGQAPFDNPAWIGIYDSDSIGVDTILLPIISTVKIDTSGPCFQVPQTLCVNYATYKANVYLPQRPGGYIIAYQRCCRNNTILNVPDPLNVGTTYWLHITDKGYANKNNGATFKTWPPIIVCVNEPLEYDHSAVDKDNDPVTKDSLHYYLCKPYEGGISIVDPQPKPAYEPPYVPITYKAPYSLANLLGGVPLAVDPHTGFMTAVPNQIGQFVVGVCVDEYRNGQLINQSFRDYQFNVVDCKKKEAIICLDENVFCDEQTVTFKNCSENTGSYQWDFGDGNTSTEFEPTHTYASTGKYQVILTTDAGTACAKNDTVELQLWDRNLEVVFDTTVLNCVDSIQIVLEEKSSNAPGVSIKAWDWKISANGNPSNYSTPTVSLLYYQNTLLNYNLIVTDTRNCKDTVGGNLNLELFKPPGFEDDTLEICANKCTTIGVGANPSYNYLWTPNTYLNNPNLPSPEACPSDNIKYSVLVSNDFGCKATKSMNIIVNKIKPAPIIKTDIVKCTDSLIVSGVVSNSDSLVNTFYHWDVYVNGSLVANYQTEKFQHYLQVPANIKICGTVTNTTADSCSVTHCDSFFVDYIPLVNFPDTANVCQGSCVPLNPNANPNLTYTWTPTQYLVPNGNVPNPQACPPNVGDLVYNVHYTDSTGLCDINDKVVVRVQDSSKVVKMDYDILCDGKKIKLINKSMGITGGFSWQVTINGNTTTLTEPSPTIDVPGPGVYKVCLTTSEPFACINKDCKDITVESPTSNLDISYDCQADQCVKLKAVTTSKYGTITGYAWTITYDNNVINSTDANPVVCINEVGKLYQACVKVIYDNGLCVDSLCENLINDCPTCDLFPDKTIQTCADSICLSDPINLPPGVVLNDIIWKINGNIVTAPGDKKTLCVAVPGTIVVCQQIVMTLNNGTTLNCTRCYNISKISGDQCDVLTTIPWCADQITLTEADLAPINDIKSVVWKDLNGATVGSGLPVTLNVPASGSITLVACITKNSGAIINDTFDLVRKVLTYNPIASADPNVVIPGNSTQLSVDLSGLTYMWSPSGTIANPNAQTTSATPTETTDYIVKVTDNMACMGFDTIRVFVANTCDYPFIFIPNTFTPNNDNVNNEVCVRGEYLIQEVEFMIYNRWGERMFYSTDKNNLCWDGVFNGKQLDPDVYGFYLNVLCVNNKRYIKKGNISLLK